MHWRKAIQAELESMQERDVLCAAKLQKNQRAIGTKWVFKIKRKADESIAKFKARLVTKGFKQQYGINYTETFLPVVKYVTLRMVIAFAKYFDWPLDQLDVVTAFLYGVMKDQVFCVMPEGVEMDGDFDSLESVKAIYGLKQASRIWIEVFDELVRSIGFQASAFDPCLYIKVVDGLCICCRLWVAFYGESTAGSLDRSEAYFSRCLRGTKSHGIRIQPSDKVDFCGYSDADWAGDHPNRKSTSGDSRLCFSVLP